MLLTYVSMGKQGEMNPPYLEEIFIRKKKTQGCLLRLLLARIKFLGRKKLKRTLTFSPNCRGSMLFKKKGKGVPKNKIDLDPHISFWLQYSISTVK